MLLNIGYKIVYECPQPTPMVLLLRVHLTQQAHLRRPDEIVISPAVPIQTYIDGFGNLCSRTTAPAGFVTLSTDALIDVSPVQDLTVPDARQIDVAVLPAETLVFLLGSRYCETDRLSEIAWSHFGTTPLGWRRS